MSQYIYQNHRVLFHFFHASWRHFFHPTREEARFARGTTRCCTPCSRSSARRASCDSVEGTAEVEGGGLFLVHFFSCFFFGRTGWQGVLFFFLFWPLTKGPQVKDLRPSRGYSFIFLGGHSSYFSKSKSASGV